MVQDHGHHHAIDDILKAALAYSMIPLLPHVYTLFEQHNLNMLGKIYIDFLNMGLKLSDIF